MRLMRQRIAAPLETKNENICYRHTTILKFQVLLYPQYTNQTVSKK